MLTTDVRCRVSYQVYADVDLSGAGDLLIESRLAGGVAKCMYSRLSEQTLRPGRVEEQRQDCIAAKVCVGPCRIRLEVSISAYSTRSTALQFQP